MQVALVGERGDAGDPASAHFLVDDEIVAVVGHLGHLLVLVRPVEVEVVGALKTAVVDVQMVDVKILIEFAGFELADFRTAVVLFKRWSECSSGRCLGAAVTGLVLLGQGV